MTPEQLLQTVEPLTYQARLRFMLDLGRTATREPAIATLLTTLAQGDFYERQLAIYACYGSRDGATALRFLTDPSRMLRGTAIKLVPLVCDEEQIRQALTLVPRAARVALLWQLRKRGYQAIIDAFLESIEREHDAQFLRLLPFGTVTLIHRYQQQLQQSHDFAIWCRLANHHPALACKLLQERVETDAQWKVAMLANVIMPIVAEQVPDQALNLVTTLAGHVPLSHVQLQPLAKKRPDAVAELILQHGEHLQVDFSALVHKLSIEHLLRLMEKYPRQTDAYLNRFDGLRPEVRAAIYAARKQSMQESNGTMLVDLVALLPTTAQREQEARRNLALPALMARPELRIPYMAFLPWDEMRSLLDPYLRNPDAELRALVLGTFAVAARYQRSHVPALLAMVKARGREQDGVRQAMLQGLADLPRTVWQQEHLQAIEQIIDDTLNAVDASAGTIYALYALVHALLHCNPGWCAEQCAAIAQKHSFGYMQHTLENWFSAVEMRELFAPALHPVVVSWEAHEDEDELRLAASWSGKRLRVFDALAEAIERCLYKTRSSRFADSVLPLLLRHRFQQAAALIPALLHDDPSWITRPSVYTYLYRHRQDLLTAFLGQQAYQGRFSSGETRFVLPVPARSLLRWTRRQQEVFADTLLEVAHDNTLSLATIVQAVEMLAGLIALRSTPLLDFTRDERGFVRDKALFLAGRLDAGQGISTLLSALEDDRARVAIYALRDFCKHAPFEQTLAILHTAPMAKVTVAKEVVRLLGSLPEEAALQELLALDRQDLPRDVRVALLRTLWQHSERAEIWPILERDALAPDPVLALSTVRMSIISKRNIALSQRKRRIRRPPRYILSGYVHTSRQAAEWRNMNAARVAVGELPASALQHLMHLFVLLLQHPQVEVRAAVLHECVRVVAADERQELLSLLLAALDTENEELCRDAAVAIFKTCVADEAATIAEAVRRLCPHRRALARVLAVLQLALAENQAQLLPVVRAVLTALADDPLTINVRVKLAIVALPWSEVTAFLLAMATHGELHAVAFTYVADSLSIASDRPDIADLAQLETALATQQDEHLRYLALTALVVQARQGQNWTDALRARLRMYQTDPSPLVAASAQFIFPPLE